MSSCRRAFGSWYGGIKWKRSNKDWRFWGLLAFRFFVYQNIKNKTIFLRVEEEERNDQSVWTRLLH